MPREDKLEEPTRAQPSVNLEEPAGPRVPDARLHPPGQFDECAVVSAPPTPGRILADARMVTVRPKQPRENERIHSRLYVGDLVDALARSAGARAHETVAAIDDDVGEAVRMLPAGLASRDPANNYLQGFAQATGRAVLFMTDTRDHAILYMPGGPPRHIPLDDCDIKQVKRELGAGDELSVIVRRTTRGVISYAYAVPDSLAPCESDAHDSRVEATQRARNLEETKARALKDSAKVRQTRFDLELDDHEDGDPELRPAQPDADKVREAARDDLIDDMLFESFRMAAYSFSGNDHFKVLANSAGLTVEALTSKAHLWIAKHKAREPAYRLENGSLDISYEFALFAHEMGCKVVHLSNRDDDAMVFLSDFSQKTVPIESVPGVLQDPALPPQPYTIIRSRFVQRTDAKDEAVSWSVELIDLARPVGDDFVELANLERHEPRERPVVSDARAVRRREKRRMSFSDEPRA